MNVCVWVKRIYGRVMGEERKGLWRRRLTHQRVCFWVKTWGHRYISQVSGTLWNGFMVVGRSIHHLVNEKWNNTRLVVESHDDHVNMSRFLSSSDSYIVFTLSFFHFLIQIVLFLSSQHETTHTHTHTHALSLIASWSQKMGSAIRGLIATWLKRKQDEALSWGELHSLLWFNYSANQN